MSISFSTSRFKPHSDKLIREDGYASASGVTGQGHPGIWLGFPGNALIPDKDFCAIIEYFFTNYDLVRNDPRLKLLKRLKKARKVRGYNGRHSRRIELGR